MKPAPFEYHAARSVDEAVALLAKYGDDAKILAGGQSLGPMLNMRLAMPSVLIDLNPAEHIASLSIAPGGDLVAGAMTRHRHLEASTEVRQHSPLLAEAVRHVGHLGIRNRGTLGGSIAHADPAAELPTAILALGAEITVQGPAGRRSLPAAELFLTFLTTALEPDEVLCEVRIPSPPAGSGQCWLEFAPRHGDYALVGLAASVALSAYGSYTHAVLAYAGVAGTPVLSTAAQLLAGAAPDPELHEHVAAAAASDLSPSNDLLASSAYKRHLVRALTRRALDTAAARAAAARNREGHP